MKKKSILFTDDSKFDRELLIKALSIKMEFTPIEATNGDECLQKIEENDIDLVLLDVLMPGKTGNETLEEIRGKRNQINLPVIMVTSKDDSADIITSLQAGANDYITKPVNYEVATSRIQTHLNLAELSLEMSRLKEIETLNALITTYNHEINNPLSIAIGVLERAYPDSKEKEKISTALWRVSDIVKKIRDVASSEKLEFEDYTGDKSKLVKLK